MLMIQYVQIKYQNGYILLLFFFIWLRNYTVVYKMGSDKKQVVASHPL